MLTPRNQSLRLYPGGLLLMPIDRLLARIDDELIHARKSLKFWRDQLLLIENGDYQAAAKNQVKHRETDISQLLSLHELLNGIRRV
ncbi:hypothetical protein LZ518_01815 [Sphingomonas sp. RB56-2]|uniref:Uncharacterized protein n=1 Tax=Sphingomonas brevis TaxID=2908206 RepID=A0ABT0S675_9SPHN|nr:hypothetical protein [Sphingomonas brevis]MCL6739876.1 hypothetical protein [Sphingomonas brevis]